jgi:hypothetical protein
MDAFGGTIVWNQFGAAIDMLENALDACPDEVWGDRSRRPEFWYVVYHTLFFLDFYPSDSSVAELWLYDLRHVQHHAAQLNLILRETTDSAPPWVGKAGPT